MYRAELILHKDLKIRIKSDHPEYLKKMTDEFAIHVKDYFFMPMFKSGVWDGKTHFISNVGLMPYGLLLDFIKASKRLFPEVKICPDEGVKKIFKGDEIDVKYDLSLYPRPYQKEAIETCLKFSKGIIRSATASGKSLVISYIIKNLMVNRKITGVRKCLIIVPSKSLVEQFKSDMIEYGLPESLIGRVYDKPKEWDRHIVISTWQSLKNQVKRLNDFHCVIGDEIHGAKAHELKTLFSKIKAKYRIGFTGTIPNGVNDQYSIKSYIGPILKEFPSGFLAEQGYISKCNVKIVRVEYDHIESDTYIGIREECFNNGKRLKIIENIINGIDDNILLLVSKIAEGETLEKLINRRCKNKEVIFLSGRDKVETREEWRQKVIKSNNIALIATYQIYQQGINIPNLKYLIMASPTKSKIRSIQSVGRTLRLHENKVDGSIIFDILDDVKYLQKHGIERISHYEVEGFNIEYIDEVKDIDFIKEEEFEV